MQRTLVLLKSDAVVRKQAGVEAVRRLLSMCAPPATPAGPTAPTAAAADACRFACFAEVAHVPRELACLHYYEHVARGFYSFIVEYLASPYGVVVMVLEGNNVVQRVRDMLGPTFVDKAMLEEGCLRGQHGVMAGMNLCHASDSPASGERECSLWLSALSLQCDVANAGKLAEAYVAKWDGKLPIMSAQFHEVCAPMLDQVRKMRELFKAEGGDAISDDDAKAMVRLALLALVNRM
ncbi:nucleoside-diphosphate kinase [Pelomyxa schiedti]|nr:nucleoside-diphosphate kinase [Pelomyxa schiedti]